MVAPLSAVELIQIKTSDSRAFSEQGGERNIAHAAQPNSRLDVLFATHRP
jgi:hypothetical protein